MSISYSQSNEQELILKHLGDVQENRRMFLDIGAFDPRCFSNTRKLIEDGWSGVMVEASPFCMANLIEEYKENPRIILVNAVVVAENNNEGYLTDFYVTKDAVSTGDTAHKKVWEGTVQYARTRMPVVDIRHLLGSREMPDHYEFVNIDIEGTTQEVLAAFLKIDRFRPRVICVEHNIHQQESVRAIAEAGGYFVAETTTENFILVRRE